MMGSARYKYISHLGFALSCLLLATSCNRGGTKYSATLYQDFGCIDYPCYAYGGTITVYNGSDQPLKFKQLHILLYPPKGEALLLTALSLDPDKPFVISPKREMSMPFEADLTCDNVVTPARHGGVLRFGVALSGANFVGGKLRYASLPSWDDLPSRGHVSEGREAPVPISPSDEEEVYLKPGIQNDSSPLNDKPDYRGLAGYAWLTTCQERVSSTKRAVGHAERPTQSLNRTAPPSGTAG